MSMTDELKTIENRDRDFAQTFLQFGGIDPESRQGKGGIEILVRALNEAREAAVGLMSRSGFVEITLRAEVYATLLAVLKRFSQCKEKPDDYTWLERFLVDLKRRDAED